MDHAELDVALIGLGRMGRFHLEAIRAHLPQLRLAAVAEPRTEVVQASRALISDAQVYDDAADALQHPGLGACIIVTPTDMHARIVRSALEGDLAVFCEKPLTLDAGTSMELGSLAQSLDLPLQVGFWRRFSPPLTVAKSVVEQGAIGRPIWLRLVQWDVEGPGAEWCDPIRSGGVFIDMGVHEFDQIEWFLGEQIKTVTGYPLPLVDEELNRVGDFDNALALVSLESGARAMVDLSRNGRYADDVRLEVLGADGAVFVETHPSPRVRVGTHHNMETVWESPGSDAYMLGIAGELAAFTLVATGCGPAETIPGALESVRATRVGEAARESANTEQPVRVRSPQDLVQG